MQRHRHFAGCARAGVAATLPLASLDPITMFKRILIAAGLLLSGASPIAQTPVAVTNFPADAQPLAAQALQERVAGKVFHVKPAASSEIVKFEAN